MNQFIPSNEYEGYQLISIISISTNHVKLISAFFYAILTSERFGMQFA